MKRLLATTRAFLVDDDGPTTVEYAVMLALIVAVLIAIVAAIGTKTKSGFESLTDQLP